MSYKSGDQTPTFQMAVATFQPLQEEVLACENVTLTLKKTKKKQQAVLVLCVPGEGSRVTLRDGAMFYVGDKDRKSIRPKTTHRVSRLESVEHSGMFDATFDFDGAVISATFETHLQREMFVSAMKRLQRDVKTGATSSGGGHGAASDVVGFVSHSVEEAANADAAARVKQLKQEKRRALAPEEESRLLQLLGTDSQSQRFADMTRLQEELAGHAKTVELLAAREVKDARDQWDNAQKQVMKLNDTVRLLQGRISVYATNLISKKPVIRKIEEGTSHLHRRLENVQALAASMRELEERLNLNPGTLFTLSQLSKEGDDLVNFFTNSDRARTVSKAMRHMETMLRDDDLDKDFPIALIKEQRGVFLKHRRMIVAKTTLYALSIIEIYRVHYLTTDAGRYSSVGRLVWRLHQELTSKLEDVGDILCAMERIDMEGFAALLRKYRASMQMVYTLEIKKFFAEARLQVKTVGFNSTQPLLGSRDTTQAAIQSLMETDMMGSTPMPIPGGSVPYFTPLGAGVASPTPRRVMSLRPNTGMRGAMGSMSPQSYRTGLDPAEGIVEVNHRDDDSVGSGKKKADTPDLFVDVPELNMAGRRLQRPGQLINVQLKPAGRASAFTSRLDPNGTGCLRPDVSFALAVEAAMDVALREEQVLANCFGLVHFTPKDPADITADDAPVDPKEEREGLARNVLLDLSLKEIFGGDAILVFENKNTEDAPIMKKPKPPLAPKKVKRRSSDDSDDDDEPEDEEEDDSADEKEAEKKRKREQIARDRRNYLKFELMQYTEHVLDRCDRVYAIPMLCMVRGMLEPSLPTAKSPYCSDILRSVEEQLRQGVAEFVAEQTESIERCGRKWMLRPHALLHCFAKLPALLRRLEATHNSLSTEVFDTADYASTIMSFVDQSFHWLDVISSIRPPTALESNSMVVSLADVIAEKLRDFAGMATDSADPKAIKRGYLAQYRHHAFFCAMFVSFPEVAFCRSLLHDRYDSCLVKRDRYEELYLVRCIFMEHLPTFARFILSAEDLSRTYLVEELSHHRTVSAEAVRTLVESLEGDVRSGVPSAAARIRKHFTRDVRPNTPEEGFHRTLLHVTWAHFVQLLETKLLSLRSMLQTWPHLRNAQIKLTLGPKELREIVDAVVGKKAGVTE
ncbi:Hypothetical protein, putative [Bodo saltans]|uniref:Uncharacterized protein n=1 Tax=Bodo saltans TaxID=75058 RepID=A0A0S4IPA7_BODSA|nr:Hypothetical protein, putative [Bodo saltans]|eukprot:CUE96520.1 Hypothetical protein, putative [Bodo saltans]